MGRRDHHLFSCCEAASILGAPLFLQLPLLHHKRRCSPHVPAAETQSTARLRIAITIGLREAAGAFTSLRACIARHELIHQAFVGRSGWS